MTIWNSENLGSVIGVTDAVGNLTGYYDYDPDGNPWPEDRANRPEDFGYTGSYLRTGDHPLYHNGLRWYDPETARWTQPDSLDQPSDPQNANRYLYVGSNPVNYVDPTGMKIWDDVADIAKEAGAGAVTGAIEGAVAGSILGPKGTIAGALSGAASGAVGGAAGGAARKAGAPDRLVNGYQTVRSVGGTTRRAATNVGKVLRK